MKEMKKFKNEPLLIDHADSRSRTVLQWAGTRPNALAVREVQSLQLARTNVFRLQTAIDLQYDPIEEGITTVPYRDAVCDLCEKTVSLALTVPLAGMQAKTRCSREIALARQIAMYLCHTTFSLLLTEVGLHFGRDRSTVAHACSLIEDKRDDLSFDVLICQLEALLCDARHAMSICVEHDTYANTEQIECAEGNFYAPSMKQLTSRGL